MSRTVLFVDDEEPILDALSRIFLDDDDVDVVTAFDAAEAFGILAQRQVDLVVSDEMLPGTDGISLLSSVRERYPDIGVMMLTGHAEDKLDEISSALGTELTVLSKPWNTPALRRLVRVALGSEGS